MPRRARSSTPHRATQAASAAWDPGAAGPAEGAGRVSRADKNRAFTIARGEGLEAFAALETAALVGDAEAADVKRCLPVAQRLYALLTGLLK